MKTFRIIVLLSVLIVLFAALAAITSIFSGETGGHYDFQSIRGQTVNIYGKGIYQHMSSDVAIQGIAQDVVTLFLAVPLLLLALYRARKRSLKSAFLLAGILNYFLVTYLFYMNMAMYNSLFLVYVMLAGLSFFAFLLAVMSIDSGNLPETFSKSAPVKFSGWFLMINAVSIAFLWLGIVVPPLLDGRIYPTEVQHYTTLNVQAFDLALFLPASFVSGWLLVKKNRYGFLFSMITLIFLNILMTALLAKIIAMALEGVNVIPVVFIIPVILIISLYCSVRMFKSIHPEIFIQGN